MQIQTLKRASGAVAYVDREESCVIEIVFYDCSEPPVELTKVMFGDLTATLTFARGFIINGRNNQNVLDINGGTVSDDGVLTLKLQPEDNIIFGALTPGEIEVHRLVLKWTWTDNDDIEMTGKAQYNILVREAP